MGRVILRLSGVCVMARRGGSVQLTATGEAVYFVGIGLGCALLFFGGVRLFALLVAAVAQFLGIV